MEFICYVEFLEKKKYLVIFNLVYFSSFALSSIKILNYLENNCCLYTPVLHFIKILINSEYRHQISWRYNLFTWTHTLFPYGPCNAYQHYFQKRKLLEIWSPETPLNIISIYHHTLKLLQFQLSQGYVNITVVYDFKIFIHFYI